MLRMLKKLAIGTLVLQLLAIVVVVVLVNAVTLPGEVELTDGTRRNVAQYVEMRDGVRLAVDGWESSLDGGWDSEGLQVSDQGLAFFLREV